MKKYYATLPSGQRVVIPSDTLEDFRVLYRNVPIMNCPPDEKVAVRDLKSCVCKDVPVRVRRGAP